ncbi:MFS transporter [Nonomuraea sp. bgisy101]|uniref:MFS transporter n=1 Tax=Nonomuraea sp. bgisy101 TaxID=3413784 RepID=UPI003D715F07
MAVLTGQTMRGERLAYFGGGFGINLLSGTIGSYILIYLTDVVGLGAAAVGTLLLVARLLDAVGDPFMGYVIDHLPERRGGRYRPYLFAGALLASAGFLAVFLAPLWTPWPLLAAWVTYLLWGFVADLVDLPFISLLPTMAADTAERSRLAGLSTFGRILGVLVINVATIPVVSSFADERTGWQVWALCLVVASLTVMAIVPGRVRERVRPVDPRRYGLRRLVTLILTNRAAMVLVTAKLSASTAIAAGGASVYYFTYNVGDRSLISVAALAMVPPTMLGALLVPALIRRVGLKAALLGALALSAAPSVAIWAAHSNVTLVLVLMGVTAVGGGATLTAANATIAELVDYAEWRFGQRAEGAFTSLAAFAAKAGAGLGGAMVAYTLALTGYVGGARQSEQALDGIVFAMTLLPAAVLVAGAIVFLAYPVTKELSAQVAAELAERRQEAIA